MLAQLATTGDALTLGIGGYALVAVARKLHEGSKYITNKQWAALVSLLYAFVVGAGVALLFSMTDWAEAINIPGTTHTLGNSSILSVIAFGLAVAATGGVFIDRNKAIDNTQTAATPSLVPQEPPAPDQIVAETNVLPDPPNFVADPPPYTPPGFSVTPQSGNYYTPLNDDSPFVVPDSDGTAVAFPSDEGEVYEQ